MWIARDEDSDLYLYSDKPTREKFNNIWSTKRACIHLDVNMFPDVKWESEPVEVEIKIKEK